MCRLLRACGAPGDEDELPAGAVGGIAYVLHDVPLRGQVRLHLPPFAEPQRRIGGQPVLREQRTGHVVTVSSLAGAVGLEFCAAYATSKFAVEGWMESLRYDVEPYGIATTIVEPGFFRTELLVDASTSWAELSIDDYAERTAAQRAQWQQANGAQSGDPAKLARALITLAEQDEPPLRFVAGADAIPTVAEKGRTLTAQAEASRALGDSLAHDNA